MQFYAQLLKSYYDNNKQISSELLNQLKYLIPNLVSQKQQICPNFGPLQRYINDAVTYNAIQGYDEQAIKFFLQQKEYQKAAGIAMICSEKLDDYEKKEQILSIAVACCNILNQDALVYCSKEVCQIIAKDVIDKQIQKLSENAEQKQDEINKLIDQKNKIIPSQVKAFQMTYTQDEVKQQFIYAAAMNKLKEKRKLSVAQVVSQLIQQGDLNMALTVIKIYKMSTNIFIQAVCKLIVLAIQSEKLDTKLPEYQIQNDINFNFQINNPRFNVEKLNLYKNKELLQKLFNYLFIAENNQNDGQSDLMTVSSNGEVQAFVSFILAANQTQDPLLIMREINNIWSRFDDEFLRGKTTQQAIISLLEVTEINWVRQFVKVQIPEQKVQNLNFNLNQKNQIQIKQNKNAFEGLNAQSRFNQIQNDLRPEDLQAQAVPIVPQFQRKQSILKNYKTENINRSTQQLRFQ